MNKFHVPPMDPREWTARLGKGADRETINLLLASLGTCWFGYYLLSPYVSLFWTVATAFWLIARRSPLIVILAAFPILVRPSTIAFSCVSEYLNGTAHLCSYGLSMLPFDHMHPELRIRYDNHGCSVLPHSRFEASIRQSILHLLVEHLGYMPGSYKGPLPSEETIRALLAKSPVLTNQEFERAAAGIRLPSLLLKQHDRAKVASFGLNVRVIQIDWYAFLYDVSNPTEPVQSYLVDY